MPIFCLTVKNVIKKVLFSSGTQTAATRPPISPWRQHNFPSEKGWLFSCLLKLHNLKIRKLHKRALSPKLR